MSGFDQNIAKLRDSAPLKRHATWRRFLTNKIQQNAAKVEPESRPNCTEITARLHLRVLSQARVCIKCNKTRIKYNNNVNV